MSGYIVPTIEATDHLDAAGKSILQEQITMWQDQSVVKVGNALIRMLDVAQLYSISAYQNPGADNDSFENYFTCKGGTYTLSMLGITGVNSGIIDIDIDGTDIVTGQDWYSGSTVTNVLKTTASITIAAGKHTLKMTVKNNHVSSSGFYMQLTKFWLERTGA